MAQVEQPHRGISAVRPLAMHHDERTLRGQGAVGPDAGNKPAAEPHAIAAGREGDRSVGQSIRGGRLGDGQAWGICHQPGGHGDGPRGIAAAEQSSDEHRAPHQLADDPLGGSVQLADGAGAGGAGSNGTKHR